MRSLPDIADSKLDDLVAPLDHVGMANIELRLKVLAGQEVIPITAKADAFVNIVDPRSKGIHMSRLFLLLQEAIGDKPINFREMHSILDRFIVSHSSMSNGAQLKLAFDLPLKRKALISEYSGWRAYPVVLQADAGPRGRSSQASLIVTYSSTCPCSAALARQLIQDKFAQDFTGTAAITRDDVLQWLGLSTSILATPHGQRSEARVSIKLASAESDLDLVALVDAIEGALKTPVQTAVKRADEQEFARLNGSNLMFAEDAARKIKAALDPLADIGAYSVEAHHFESLHAHDAVAKVSKS